MKHSLLTAQSIWVLSTGVVLLAGLYWYSYALIGDKREEARNLHKAIVAERAQKIEQTEITEVLRSTAPAREKLSSFFLEKDKAFVFLEDLESLGKASAVSITITSANEEKEGLKVSFTATGAFNKIFQVLKLVETMPNYTRLENILIEKISTEEEKAPSRFRLVATVRVLSVAP